MFEHVIQNRKILSSKHPIKDAFHRMFHKPKSMIKSRILNFEFRVKMLEFNRDFEKYLDHVESVSGVEISNKQRGLIERDIETHTYTKLSPEDSQQRRREFNYVKKELISDWERNTGKEWSRYSQNVYNNDGKVIRRAGNLYDAHEIILNSWGSPHEWWNLTPVPHPEHQREVHGKNSPCSKIFGRN
jgi:hypothetical protein